MHMINTRTLQLATFPSEEGLRYAILSHRWLQYPLEEVLFQDMPNLNECPNPAGVDKLKSFCALAASMGYEWCWMDTCCIDKTSSAELSEAINSMYRWYQSADICVAYLADVHHEKGSAKFKTAFSKSDWFTRCWTLQELLAPPPDQIEFYNATRGVDEPVLLGIPLSAYSVAVRMAWAAHLTATRVEDQAYSLMGIFDVNMAMLCGEGTRAFERFCENIIQYTNDETIFAWSADETFQNDTFGLLAPSPYHHRGCRGLKPMNLFPQHDVFALTSRGLTSMLVTTPPVKGVRLAFLNAGFVGKEWESYVAVYLDCVGNNLFECVRKLSSPSLRKVRLMSPRNISILNLRCFKIYVRHRGHQKVHAPSWLYGVDLSNLLPSCFGFTDSLPQPSMDKFRSEKEFSIQVAPDCRTRGPPTYIRRPNTVPQGPLCNIVFHRRYNGISAIQLGIEGDFFTASPILLLYRETSPEDKTHA